MADNPGPAVAIGFWFTVIVFVAVIIAHKPPLVVKVKVMVPDSVADAV
jgi:hypothetical protein